jgi:primosomal protein N' (replication factor Y)
MYYFEVAPTQLIRLDSEVFTYAFATNLGLGTLVRIEVGKKQLTGVILRQVSAPTYATKSISDVIENVPLPAALIATARWMSLYYATPLATVLQTILPTGLTKKRRASKSSAEHPSRNRTKNVLTPDQTAALESIRSMSQGSALLHGVTGSGKTRVYLEAAKESLAAGQSVILLVPEIALTSQLVADFQHDIDNILLTHSTQTEAERHNIWLEALTSPLPRVVIGPRSALFTPLAHVGLVIIDECHEPSFKQEQAPRYSALRAASTLVHHTGGKLVMGSATPLISDYYIAAQTGRPIVPMPKPAVSGATPPTITLVDMTKRMNFERHHFLSDKLIEYITTTLASNNQVLLFHNRRGSASTTLCTNCGWYAGCERCFIPLTLHADSHELICHVCGNRHRVPTVCPECGYTDIIHKGIGTKLIESEVRKLFPDASIARFDGDTSSDDTVNKRYQELYDGRIQILIGTQVLAKGLDLPHLRTVGVIQADAGLSLPDYSSSERTFQLLAQVIGRVGRSTHATDVIVQSYQPSSPVIRDALAQDYVTFYERTIGLRKMTQYPPFCFLLKLTCIYKTEATAIRNSKRLAGVLRSAGLAIEVLGPTPAFYERVRDTYRWQLVVKAQSRQELLKALSHLPPKNWQYELDPLSLL